MNLLTIGVIDDEIERLMKIERALVEMDNCQVFISVRPDVAGSWIEQGKIDLLASDFNLEINTDGLMLLKSLRVKYPSFPLVLFSSSGFTAAQKAECESNSIKHFDSLIKKDKIEDMLNYILELSRKEFGENFEKVSDVHIVQKEIVVENKFSRLTFNKLKEEAISDLLNKNNDEKAIVTFGEEELTPAELADEIRNDSEVGQEYVYYWNQLRSRIIRNRELNNGFLKRYFKWV